MVGFQTIFFFSPRYLKDVAHSIDDRCMGKFMSWAINQEDRLFYGMKLPTGK